MCLVLGCPGAGCTTFLKAIANQRDGYARVSGEVLYAGITAEEMAKRYEGEVVYNHESNVPTLSLFLPKLTPALIDDLHIATLTVAQTISFALATLVLPFRHCDQLLIFFLAKHLGRQVASLILPATSSTRKSWTHFFGCSTYLIPNRRSSGTRLCVVFLAESASESVSRR